MLFVAVQVASVQQSSALALGRLANYSVDLAEEIVDQGILPPLVSALTSDNVRAAAVLDACCLLCVACWPASVCAHVPCPVPCSPAGCGQKYFQKSGAFALRAISKHGPLLAGMVVEAGALDPLVRCLENFDVTVKEAAAFALGYVATHSEGAGSSSLPSPAHLVILTALCLRFQTWRTLWWRQARCRCSCSASRSRRWA